MKFFSTMMALMILVYMSMFVGVAMAEPGVGACAAGIGLNIGINVDGSYTGVNVHSPMADPTGFFGFGQNSTTGIYSDQTDFQTQCCAETGSPPDCFDPVEP